MWPAAAARHVLTEPARERLVRGESALPSLGRPFREVASAVKGPHLRIGNENWEAAWESSTRMSLHEE